MQKKFCVNTRGLKPEERKELAESLNDFVKEKKEEFTERRQESKDADQSDEP